MNNITKRNRIMKLIDSFSAFVPHCDTPEDLREDYLKQNSEVFQLNLYGSVMFQKLIYPVQDDAYRLQQQQISRTRIQSTTITINSLICRHFNK